MPIDAPHRDWLCDKLLRRLSPKRYIHSLAVAELAERWAPYHQLDAERAYLAGLLHDAARDMSTEQLLAAAEHYQIPVDEVIADNPLILHAEVGACYAEEHYCVHDATVLEAIARHTIPAAEMSDLAKLIYLTDICEPNRRWWPGREILTQLAVKDLDEAMIFGISETMSYLQEKGLTPHPHTIRVLESFQARQAEALPIKEEDSI